MSALTHPFVFKHAPARDDVEGGEDTIMNVSIRPENVVSIIQVGDCNEGLYRYNLTMTTGHAINILSKIDIHQLSRQFHIGSVGF